MRYTLVLVVGAMLLLLAKPTSAQAGFPGLWNWWGPPSGEVKYSIVSPYDANTPIASPVSRSLSFKLQSLLPTFSLPGNRPVIGSSTFPTESEAFSQDYLKAFGIRRVKRTWIP